MSNRDIDEQREHRDLSPSIIADRLRTVKIGDELLFNDRKIPLKVIDSNDYYLKVEGPRGGKYNLSKNGEKMTRRAYGDETPGLNPVVSEQLWWAEVVNDR